MVATRKTRAIVICVFPALIFAGTPAEAVCGTDANGNHQACAKPLGQSILQKTSGLHEHSLSVTEMEDGTTSEVCPWSWEQGYASGGGNTERIVEGGLTREECEQKCAEAARKASTINGCQFGLDTKKGMVGVSFNLYYKSSFLPCMGPTPPPTPPPPTPAPPTPAPTPAP
eukprot:CAMPEP_0175301788 /NCGR_PEP_ID=MMETSP0093-20121207/61830_1 /TAXON_ID=311494 /ORGANISM="Alexandrium monilatum, Strain CCMP3105" /LENGTH=170 /DNA_ID=CAMNT_0016598037 /DNA_START=72 /DNA_END=580 /DNA_ORIENTATION=+